MALWGGIPLLFNSLAPGRSECDFKDVIFNLVLLTGIFRSSYVNVLRLMPQDLTDDKSLKSILVQVMAITWTSVDQDLRHRMASLGPNEIFPFFFLHFKTHWLPHFFLPRSTAPYGFTRSQCVKITTIVKWLLANGLMPNPTVFEDKYLQVKQGMVSWISYYKGNVFQTQISRTLIHK